ncbi:MAG TPA: type II toxin-antitoxin system RelE/ParE family toxin [Gemmatimonadaceae bacterium]|nr:type II toxin-antitoxin system RelE/ParE family toxin [Gemmatimonadaceae bacterium]
MTMPGSLTDVHFVRLKTFDRTVRGLLSDDDERDLEEDIAGNPKGAPVIAETGGVRKIRARIGQRGKRGGARVLYLYVEDIETVYLLWVFPKNVRENITKPEKKIIRGMVARLKEE